jgi:hypothetical protein
LAVFDTPENSEMISEVVAPLELAHCVVTEVDAGAFGRNQTLFGVLPVEKPTSWSIWTPLTMTAESVDPGVEAV